MHAEVEELRPKLKEILYDCAVDIRATKAALYLFDGSRNFELVTEYGFRDAARPITDGNDALVDRCGRGRTPFFVNGLAAEPRFSELLYAASTDRLLAAPLYSRGKLIGLIDMRDKAGKQPFEQTDVAKAQSIADRLVEVLADKPIFGHRVIQLSTAPVSSGATGSQPVAPSAPAPAPAAKPAPKPAPVEPPAPAPPPKPAAPVASLATLVIDARSAASRIAAALPPPSLTEHELAAARDVLRSILLIPGAVAATFSAYGHLGGVQEISARSTLLDDAKNLLQSKLNVWLTKRGEAGGHIRTAVLTPFGTSGPAITAADIQKVFTAPLNAATLRGLYLTVAFNTSPERVAHELLGAMHAQLQVTLEHSLQRGALNALQSRVAEKILEPDFAKVPALRRHTSAVASLCEAFARHLGLSAAEVEQARLVALVHDAGMRLLDYERLYRKHDLSQEELGFLREHPSVGAAIVEPLLGAEIARAVLCHHERVDGRGYPNELHGDEIPLVSRILQICDAFVAMTDPDTYQQPEPKEVALATITRAAGSQFDASLAAKFVEMMRSAQ